MTARFVLPLQTALESVGVTIPGARATFYVNKTTTILTTFKDIDLTIPNADTVIADSSGRWGDIFSDQDLVRFVFEDADEKLIYDKNDVPFGGTSTSEILTVIFATGDGVTTSFDTGISSIPTDVLNYDINIQGIAQKKSEDTYTISGSIVEFAIAPPNSMLVEIMIKQPAASVQTNAAVLGDGSELTIVSGAVTISTGYHIIDTEADAGTDDLDTINGGSKGMELVIASVDAARNVVVKDGTGNLLLAGDFTLADPADTIRLIYNGANWQETSRSTNT